MLWYQSSSAKVNKRVFYVWSPEPKWPLTVGVDWHADTNEQQKLFLSRNKRTKKLFKNARPLPSMAHRWNDFNLQWIAWQRERKTLKKKVIIDEIESNVWMRQWNRFVWKEKTENGEKKTEFSLKSWVNSPNGIYSDSSPVQRTL